MSRRDKNSTRVIPREAEVIARALRGEGTTPTPPTVDLGDARIDLDRERRRGMPEVIYCAGKTVDQIVRIARTLHAAHGFAYGTRCSVEQGQGVMEHIPEALYDRTSRTLLLGAPRPRFTDLTVGVLCAGTSDLPVAEEACRTLETFGAPVERFVDVGVAGLHRLMEVVPALDRCSVLIVVAGMEGALPSVVSGLVSQPVIGVPTSIGYGAAQEGMTALHAMLTSCSSGIVVVNIDNGFGAACAALSMVRMAGRGSMNDGL